MSRILTRLTRQRSGQQDLLVGIGVALAVGLLLGVGLLFLRPSQVSPPAESGLRQVPEPVRQQDVAPSRAVRPAIMPQSQRLLALPAEKSQDAAADPGEETVISSRRAASDPEPERQDATSPSNDQEASGPAKPAVGNAIRKLLRRARRQAHAGDVQAGIATARDATAYIPGGEGRQQAENALADADTAAAAGQNVDFDSLIELIESTIAPDTWATVGGEGTIEEFPGGVFVDANGVVQRGRPEKAADLASVREAARNTPRATDPESGLAPAPLRKVSLPKLERAVARCLHANQPLGDEMRCLAGLRDVTYLLLYPDDVVIAGPAETWRRDHAGRALGTDSARPVLQLDDLVVILRNVLLNQETLGSFSCGIYPRRQNLERVQQFLADAHRAGPIHPARRDEWVQELRDQLGLQDIRISGIPPGSRVANVLIEADIRMKLIGIGVEPAAAPGLADYFELLGIPDRGTLERPVDTLRWWFTLSENAPLLTSPDNDAFQLPERLVEVLSENELLTRTGQRVHTGQAEPVNEAFAARFTAHFPELADRDPTFADLENVYDLAMVAALLKHYDVPHRAGWKLGCFADADQFLTLQQPTPRAVETVMNYRVYHGRHILAVVSGGVHVNPWKVVKPSKIAADPEGKLHDLARSATPPSHRSAERWWWD